MCAWVTLLCSRKLIEHCKSSIMEKVKIFMKKKKKESHSWFFLWRPPTYLLTFRVLGQRDTQP